MGGGLEGWEGETNFKYLATDLKPYKDAQVLQGGWGGIPIISSVHI